ncbi:MAG: flagellar basal body P-ring protein FlgI [Planctomycetaceae bacterium]
MRNLCCNKRVILLAMLVAMPQLAIGQQGIRIKDLTDVEGFRANRLTGMGLIAGLNGTGGKSPITRQFAQHFEQRFGIRASPAQRLNIAQNTQIKTDNLSVVLVTADVPPFSSPGSKIDVTVSTFDDAKSIQGGYLMDTVLTGLDEQPYGVSSGPVSIGGFSFGGDAASVQKNHPTVGRIPNGFILEEPIVTKVGNHGTIRLALREPDFTTASRITRAINTLYPLAAVTLDPGNIEVSVPGDQLGDVNNFYGKIGSIRVQPDLKARVVINERTGTVIVGSMVRLSEVAVTHANLSIITTENPQISQPAPFSDGVTAAVPRTEVDVMEERRALTVMGNTTTVGDLAQALNALGVAPRDLSSIFQQLKVAGVLHAELAFE